MNISVAMATYNGAKYIEEQIDSILKQLNLDDELVVSDDNSNDSTLEILKKYQNTDKRILIYPNEGKGILANFENAISKCSNEIIFLSDQDDIWLGNKVQIVKNQFTDCKVSLVLSDCYIVDSELKVIYESFYERSKTKRGIIKNVIKNSYLGCGMAFRSELKSIILPFPKDIPMHDAWIGILAEMYGEVSIIPDKLFCYRRHNSNATQIESSNLKQMFIWRKNLIKNLYRRKRELNE